MRLGRAHPKINNFLLLVAVNFVFIALVLYGFEYYLRHVDPARRLPFDGVKNGSRYTWGNLVTNNKFGFRERDFSIHKPHDMYRIMVLGDSLTWGAGLKEEERYSDLIEQELNKKLSPQEFEVVNFGVSGGPTTTERDILLRYKDIVAPDLIIVGFCVNDPQPKSEDYSREREAFEKKFKLTLRLLRVTLESYRLEEIGKLLEEGTYGFAERIGIIPPLSIALQRVYEKDSQEWKAFCQALKDIKDTSDKMNLPPPIFATLDQAVWHDRATNYEQPDEYMKVFMRWYRQAEDAARVLGFRTCNFEHEIAIYLAAVPNDSLCLNALDGHPSAQLNKIYASKLAAIVGEEYLKQVR